MSRRPTRCGGSGSRRGNASASPAAPRRPTGWSTRSTSSAGASDGGGARFRRGHSPPARSAELRLRIDDGLRLALGDAPEAMRPLCGEALGVTAVAGAPVRGGGKRLRPLLCLQVCDALGGDPNLALLPALAPECIHPFPLV